jgi:hypothetical protein
VDFYKGIPIIDCAKEENRAIVNPMGVGSGLVPRDFAAHPHNVFGAPPSEIQTIPKSDWDAYYDEQEEQESSLEHIFLRGGKPAFVNLDQNGDGDCWAYSTGHAIMLQYLRDNPGGKVPRLNPHFIATYLRRFNGGWCGASMDVATRVGCCEEGTGPDQWPLHSHSTGLLTQVRLDAAAKHKVVRNIYDIAKPIYGQEMTELQSATLGLTNVPAPEDFNEMSHSMCKLRWVRIERGSWAPLIINSWRGWGRDGLGVLRNMDCDGAVAVLAMNPR